MTTNSSEPARGWAWANPRIWAVVVLVLGSAGVGLLGGNFATKQRQAGQGNDPTSERSDKLVTDRDDPALAKERGKVGESSGARSPGPDENSLPAKRPLQSGWVSLKIDGRALRVPVTYAEASNKVFPMTTFHIERVTVRDTKVAARPLFGADGRAGAEGLYGEVILGIEVLDLENSPDWADALRAEFGRLTKNKEVVLPDLRAEFGFVLSFTDRDNSTKKHELARGTLTRKMGQSRIHLDCPISAEKLGLLRRADRDRMSLAITGSYRALFTRTDLSVSSTVIQTALSGIDMTLRSTEGPPALLITGGGGKVNANQSLRQSLNQSASMVVSLRRDAVIPPDMLDKAIEVVTKHAYKTVDVSTQAASTLVAFTAEGLPPVTLPLGKLTGMAKATKKQREEHAAQLLESAEQSQFNWGARASGWGFGGEVNSSGGASKSNKAATEKMARALDELHEQLKGDSPRVTAMDLQVVKKGELNTNKEFKADFDTFYYDWKTLPLELSMQSMADLAAAVTPAKPLEKPVAKAKPMHRHLVIRKVGEVEVKLEGGHTGETFVEVKLEASDKVFVTPRVEANKPWCAAFVQRRPDGFVVHAHDMGGNKFTETFTIDWMIVSEPARE